MDFARPLAQEIEARPPTGFGSYQEVLDFLHLSPWRFQQQVCDAFERFKTQPQDIRKTDNSFELKGTTGILYKVSGKLIDQAINAGTNKVLEFVASVIDNDTKTIITSGGFGRSKQLYDALCQRYHEKLDRIVLKPTSSNSDLCLPVTHGALHRHSDIDVQDQPSRVASESEWTNTTFVKDRVAVLLRKGEAAGNRVGSTWAYTTWYTSADIPTIVARICWSKDNVEDSRALIHYEEHVEYEEWKTVTQPISVDILKSLGYSPTASTRKDRDQTVLSYKLSGRVILDATGAFVKVGFQLCRAGTEHQVAVKGDRSKNLLEFWPKRTLWTSNKVSSVASNTDWADVQPANDSTDHTEHLSISQRIHNLGRAARPRQPIEADHLEEEDLSASLTLVEDTERSQHACGSDDEEIVDHQHEQASTATPLPDHSDDGTTEDTTLPQLHSTQMQAEIQRIKEEASETSLDHSLGLDEDQDEDGYSIVSPAAPESHYSVAIDDTAADVSEVNDHDASSELVVFTDADKIDEPELELFRLAVAGITAEGWPEHETLERAADLYGDATHFSIGSSFWALDRLEQEELVRRNRDRQWVYPH